MTTYKEIFGKPIKSLTGDPAPTPITYTVTVANPGSGNVYYIDGVQTPTLELYEGNTYNFDYSAATGHPFRFATAADAAGSTEYTTGVSVDSNITTIVVASGAPNLFYYCTNHNGMGGRALTPASPSEYEGQIWYNETTGKFRSIVSSGAWSSSSNAITVMHAGQGFGGQSDAVGAGGYGPGLSPAYSNATDEYNGSGWGSGGNIGSARYTGQGCGSQTAGLIAGGNPVSNSEAFLGAEEYDGSSWTAGGTMGTGHGYAWMAGIQTAAIVYTGLTDPSPATTTTNAEEYNGTAWSEVGNVNTAKYGILGFGATKDTAVKVGGTSANTGVEEYNGTSWTAVNSIPANRADGMGSGAQTSGLITAGNPGAYTSTLLYDGTNWTTSPATLATGRAGTARGATISNNLTSIVHHAGPGTAKMLLTEEWNFTANTITAAAWASSNNLNTGRNAGAGFGIQTAAVMTGGNAPPESNATEEYDGSSWTSVTNYPASKRFIVGTGTLTAGLVAGGNPYTNQVTKYDGTNWTTVNTLPASTGAGTMFGTQTAAVYSVGRTPASTNGVATTSEYDGTNWTSGGAAGTARYFLDSSGTLTAGLMFGGATSGPTARNETEEYNGTAWSEQNNLGTARYGLGSSGAGTQTDTIAFAGNNPAVVLTEGYDGTSWSTRPNMATARRFISGAGTATAGLAFGGNPPNNSTEEFTGETTALNKKNISTS